MDDGDVDGWMMEMMMIDDGMEGLKVVVVCG